ncbi:MAG: polysaccharide deacetylase [Phyllobacteriaceae bacterium]|jgi:peptidoglycan/xylan/chitin deacetylase (PgdA/CDA1 family)|nr:polysaccharide deacetylase [Phyllobacteriaceae bacterium]
MPKEILVSYGVDFDAVAGWLGSYGGEDSPCDISRGVFAAEVGVSRLLELFRRQGICTTWFIPGHSAESFPAQTEAVVTAGHEIGLHGYSHENPLAMTLEQEEEVLEKSRDLLVSLTGRAPRGYVAPWWEFSPNTARLLIDGGIVYDHSMMHRDFEPYYLPVGESWTKIDFTKPAAHWMKPYRPGRPSPLIEIPASWLLDDMPPQMFMKASPNSHGYVTPRQVEELWREQFDWVYREYDYAVFPMTIHPDVSGRPQTLLMHERLIGYFRSFPGVRFCTLEEVADDFAQRMPFGPKQVA